MKRDLLIISDSILLETELRAIKLNTDLLATTPIAILSLDNLNIPYKTLDNFVDLKIFRNDSKKILSKLDKIFKKLDNKCLDFIDFPYSYSGNRLGFFVLLTHLYYIEQFLSNIENKYNTIYVPNYQKKDFDISEYLNYEGLNFSPQSISSISFNQLIKT